jgi:hypothetical protein
MNGGQTRLTEPVLSPASSEEPGLTFLLAQLPQSDAGLLRPALYAVSALLRFSAEGWGPSGTYRSVDACRMAKTRANFF